jgi:hypothetical protein
MCPGRASKGGRSTVLGLLVVGLLVLACCGLPLYLSRSTFDRPTGVAGLAGQPGGTPAAAAPPRLAAWEAVRVKAEAHPFGRGIRQIPATVIDTGPLRHVPYLSLRTGGWEVNVYGDPERPCCVEAGLYGRFIEGPEPKHICRRFVQSLLLDAGDREFIETLGIAPAVKRRGGLTFEVTPETAEDAYGGWWVSVYDEAELERSRASQEELKTITVGRDEVARSVEPPDEAAPAAPAPAATAMGQTPAAASKPAPPARTAWTSKDLVYARPAPAGHPSGGLVYVHSYTRKDGTYVSAHYRRYPRR